MDLSFSKQSNMAASMQIKFRIDFLFFTPEDEYLSISNPFYKNLKSTQEYLC